MRAAIARLRSLYNRAGSISQVLSVENALAPREADLEALEAEQRALASQTATATINLHLLTLAAPTPTKHHASGFLSGLQNGWDAFVASVRWLLAALGALLPFLAVLAAIGGGLLILRRRRASRPPVAPAEPD